VTRAILGSLASLFLATADIKRGARLGSLNDLIGLSAFYMIRRVLMHSSFNGPGSRNGPLCDGPSEEPFRAPTVSRANYLDPPQMHPLSSGICIVTTVLVLIKSQFDQHITTNNFFRHTQDACDIWGNDYMAKKKIYTEGEKSVLLAQCGATTADVEISHEECKCMAL
jgi:hypothetical protein